jgi:hypothetical protein
MIPDDVTVRVARAMQVADWRTALHGETFDTLPDRDRQWWLDEADAALAELAAASLLADPDALGELAAWHAECDRVGVPYDPEGLVRHVRNGPLGALQIEQGTAARLRQKLAEAQDALGRAKAEAE